MDFWTLLLFVGGFIALILGAEWLVRGASRLAVSVGISPLVVGLTVVAFGTSAPELGVSVMSSNAGQAGIAVGNVVGSNICNVLLILGLSALAAPLVVSRQLLRIEVPLMIGVSLLAWGMALDGAISRLDGLLLFAGVIAYTVWAIRRSRRESRETEGGGEEREASKGGLARQLLLILAGLALLGVGSDWLVTGAVTIAKALGVSDLLIGLTVVSIGTSLPELATSVMASLRGEREMAVGNVVGSNLFNLMAVLGLTAVVTPGGVSVSAQAVGFDIPVMVAVMIVCLPIFYTGYRICRWEGGLFLGYYLCYTLYLVLEAVGHPLVGALSSGLVQAAIPLSGLLVAAAVVHAVYTGRGKALEN